MAPRMMPPPDMMDGEPPAGPSPMPSDNDGDEAAMQGAQPTAMGEPADAEPPHLIGGQRGAAPRPHKDGGRHAPNHGGTHRGHEPSGQHRHHGLMRKGG